jgi:hypothetical protein
VHKDMASTDDEETGRESFHRGQIASMIQADWATGLRTRAFPRGLSTEYAELAERTRPRQ